MSYLSTTINESSVIAGEAAAAIDAGAFHAVKFDTAGKFVLAGAGEAAIGILTAETDDKVSTGDVVTVQIKDIGMWVAGAAIAAGDLLSCDANGKAVKSAEGKFILATALQSGSTGQAILVQICKSGFAVA